MRYPNHPRGPKMTLAEEQERLSRLLSYVPVLSFEQTEFARMDPQPVATIKGPANATNAALTRSFGQPIIGGKYGGLWTFVARKPFPQRVFTIYLAAKGSEIAASKLPPERFFIGGDDAPSGKHVTPAAFKTWLSAEIRKKATKRK